MAKKIFPGNWVTNLSSYQGQPVVAIPGRVYYHKVGYALVDSTGGTEFDVTIPSPDKRGDDKVRADITSMTIPAGAVVYSVGLRVSDTRKNLDAGSATSGLSGTNTDTIALKDAAASAASSDISIKAKPLLRPVSRSKGREQLATSPKGANSSTTSSFSARKGKLPTKILT